MESSAVPDMRRFEFHADDKAKEATVCMSTRQEESALLRAPRITECLLEPRAADGKAFLVVCGPPETFWDSGGYLQHCHVVALCHGALFPFHKKPPNHKGHAVEVEQMSRKHLGLTGEAPGSSPWVGPSYMGRRDIPLTRNVQV